MHLVIVGDESTVQVPDVMLSENCELLDIDDIRVKTKAIVSHELSSISFLL